MVGESEEALFVKGMSPAGSRTHNHQITDVVVSALLTELRGLSYD